LRFFYRDGNISYGELFFSCALIACNIIFSWFNSWVAEAIGVKFLDQGNNSSRWASNLEPYDYQADALAVCYCLPKVLPSPSYEIATCVRGVHSVVEKMVVKLKSLRTIRL